MDENEKFSAGPFRDRNRGRHDSDNSDKEEPIRLDLGIDPSHTFERVSETEGAVAGPSSVEVNRKEDNPFSFKHFLRNTSTNYQNQGARPKVYCDGRPVASISDLELNSSPGIKQTRIVSEFPSALPDFVQDHLVMEQSFLEKDNVENGFNIGSGNLPDFTPHRTNTMYSHLNGETSRSRRSENDMNNIELPLDLPGRPVHGYPLDLPIIENNGLSSRNSLSASEVGASKSLPDFLNDGAVRNQTTNENLPGANMVSELTSLRLTIELYQQQLTEQIQCTEHLRKQLNIARKKEVDYTKNINEALEQVEQNLEQSNQKVAVVEAENTKLKQEIKSLKNKTKLLQQENNILKREQGGGSSKSQVAEKPTYFLAQDLKHSANSAEQSLRQLLQGVESLRIVAAALENLNRIEEKDKTSTDTEDNGGPAL